DLPVRYTELGTVYRYEKSGVLHGLVRVRGFTQDDGHIFCREDQMEEEIFRAVKLTKHILESFGFRNFKVALSVRDPKKKKKYLGSDKDWKKSEEALIKGIKDAGWNYEREEGEAVFYGPKMDIKTTDAIGREWQISTLQVDFNLPKKFDVFYTDKDGKKKQVFMLHRALLGSLERFTGVLIEHYAGAFPVWLSPVQTRILPVSEKFNDYAKKVLEELKEAEIRTEIDESNETLGKKIRSAELQKIPYILVVGEKEKESRTVSLRERGKGDLGAMPLEKFIEKIKKEISEKK
ncbi:MAG: threonine--tRNA ligase, partial [Candidatus Parcubacteria bacterium]|nr:threonine--tRNA ligase [Candidatus Parcubacteria bacterium]